MTKLWDHAQWSRHQNSLRYFRHLVKWPVSTTLKIVSPVCLVYTAWSIILHAFLNSHPLPPTLNISPVLTLLSSAVALLLTLRTNQVSDNTGHLSQHDEMSDLKRSDFL